MKTKKLLLTAIAILGFAFTTMAQVPPYVPTSGLLGWYPFNGNANDESGNGNNGTVTSANLMTDRFGSATGCYEFTNSSSKIHLGNNINPTTAFTTSAWVYSYAQAPGWNQTIISKRGQPECAPFHGFDFSISNASYNRTFGCSMGTGSLWAGVNTVTSFTSDNIWTHLITTYDGIVAKIYLNGVLTASMNSSYYCASPCFTVIGNRNNDGANTFFFNGRIDDVGIWNRALTLQEITTLYQGCVISVTSHPNNQNVFINTSVQFVTASSDPLATYQWEINLGLGWQTVFNAGQYSGATDDTLHVSTCTLLNNNQLFRCIATKGSCADTSNVATLTVTDNTGIIEATQNQFKVYPNPATSQINVQTNAGLVGSTYTITDQLGKTVLTGKLNAENSIIELGNLSGGIYMFNVGESRQGFKVLKE